MIDSISTNCANSIVIVPANVLQHPVMRFNLMAFPASVTIRSLRQPFFMVALIHSSFFFFAGIFRSLFFPLGFRNLSVFLGLLHRPDPAEVTYSVNE